MSATTSRTWDMGDEIPTEVLSVTDGTEDDCDGCSPTWGRTYTPGEWKGYKDGGKCYVSESELLRRWGPVTEEQKR